MPCHAHITGWLQSNKWKERTSSSKLVCFFNSSISSITGMQNDKTLFVVPSLSESRGILLINNYIVIILEVIFILCLKLYFYIYLPWLSEAASLGLGCRNI